MISRGKDLKDTRPLIKDLECKLCLVGRYEINLMLGTVIIN